MLLEYNIKKAIKLHPHLWLTNQFLVNAALAILLLFSTSLLSILCSAALIAIALIIDLFIHIKENRHQEEIGRVKEIQQLTSMLEDQEKLNKRIKERNNALYSKTKLKDTDSFSKDLGATIFDFHDEE